VRGPTPRRLWKYVVQRLRLQAYFRCPGDGRLRPQIPAQALLWGLLIGQILREYAFHGVEALVRSPARPALGVRTPFSDDALGYFTERLDPAPTRTALARTVGQAKRNKAFAASPYLGLVLDGTTVGHCTAQACSLCRPLRNAAHEIIGYRHHGVMLSITGQELVLPVDVELYGPGDSEYEAGQRVLRRAGGNVGVRFADYVVVDGEFATAPFLHTAGEVGLHVVARLKENLPELLAAVQERFAGQVPHATFAEGKDRVEVWDADDFDPWEALQWKTVRVLRYRQYKPTGEVIEASWLTDFPTHVVDSQALYRMAKSRWTIENQGFNDAKTRYGLEHLCHHEANSLLITWLLTAFALTIERLYRLRYLHRGSHPVRASIDLVRALRVSLGRPLTADTS
jgi:hypothetical protein